LYRLSDKNPLGYRPWIYRIIILEIHLNVESKLPACMIATLEDMGVLSCQWQDEVKKSAPKRYFKFMSSNNAIQRF
jgi:hypothetical protein